MTEKNDRDMLANILINELPVLRAKLGISQAELARIIGISRQTYCSIELKKRKPNWNTILSLFLFFQENEPTKLMMEIWGDFERKIKTDLKIDNKRENLYE